jgi:uncharacterized protein HemX
MDRIKSEKDFQGRIVRFPSMAMAGYTVATALLVFTLVVGAIFYVWLYMQQVQNGYRLAKLYEQHETLLAIERKLRLEWCRFQDPNQLEELGRTRFGLGPPRQDQKIVVR